MKLKTKKLATLMLALLALDFSVAEAAREKPIVPQGLQGLTGQKGPQGPKGDTGAHGVNAATHFIGESYAGGEVFWVDAAGEHGLIAALADQSAGIQWSTGIAKSTNTSG